MKSLSLACLLVCAISANADEISGAHIGAGGGQFKATESGVTVNDSAYKAFIGYRFNRSLGIEAGYFNGGSPGGINVDGEFASLVGAIPVGSNASVFVRAGGLRWNTDGAYFYWAGGRLYSYSYADSGSEFMWGAGLQATAGHFGFRAEYERSDVDYGKYELVTGSLLFLF